MKQYQYESLTLPFNFNIPELSEALLRFGKNGFELVQAVDCPNNKDAYEKSSPIHIFIFKKEVDAKSFETKNENKEPITLTLYPKKDGLFKRLLKKW